MCGLSVEEVSTSRLKNLSKTTADYLLSSTAAGQCYSLRISERNHVASQSACSQIQQADSDVFQAGLAKAELVEAPRAHIHIYCIFYVLLYAYCVKKQRWRSLYAHLQRYHCTVLQLFAAKTFSIHRFLVVTFHLLYQVSKQCKSSSLHFLSPSGINFAFLCSVRMLWNIA